MPSRPAGVLLLLAGMWLGVACPGVEETPTPSSTPELTPTPLPPRPQSVQGAWAFHATGPMVFDNDLNGPDDDVSLEVWSLVGFEEDGHITTSVCRVDIGAYDDGSQVVILFNIPDEVVRPGVATSPAEANVDGGWDEGTYGVETWITSGVVVDSSNPTTSALPTEDTPEDASNDDGDSYPGVTVLLTVQGLPGGVAEGLSQDYDTGVAFRLGQTFKPDRVEAENMSGEVDFRLDISLLSVSPPNPYLVVQDIYTSPSPAGDHTFEAVPLVAGATCDDVLGLGI